METQERIKPGPKCPMEPIKSKAAIQKIKDLLKDNPRDYALFTLGINSAFRAGDLLALNVGDVRFKGVNDIIGTHSLGIREGKTEKFRMVMLNDVMVDAIEKLLATMPDAENDEPLFQSSAGRKVFRGQRLKVQTLQRKVAQWCAAIRLKGTFGSHTLRKTWAYQKRMKGAGVDLLQDALGHSSAKTTMAYACIQRDEIAALYKEGI